MFLHTKVFHRRTFTQRNFYTKKLVRTDAFRPSSFYAKKLLHRESLPIFHHVSFFTTIHHLSFLYLRFHALLVHSLCRLVFMSHGVLSVHVSSWLPLRRSKVNENPGINTDENDGIESIELIELAEIATRMM